jgi:hypothetical protein
MQRGAQQPRLRIKSGLTAADVTFAPLGRDRIASSRTACSNSCSWRAKFGWHAPSPSADTVATLAGLRAAACRGAAAEIEQVMFRGTAIAREIPAQDTAMQWDVAVEITMALEGLNPPLAAAFRSAARGHMADAAIACHATWSWACICATAIGRTATHQAARHGVNLTLFANELFSQLHRPLNWIHIPVPMAREDAAYFCAAGLI